MKYSINLAQKKRLAFFEQISYFFFNYLRYILVFTQLIVIGVLFYRFRIDQNIIDLKERIGDKKVILKETEPFIVEAKKIELQSSSIYQVLDREKKLSEMMEYTFSKFPSEAFLSRIEIREGSITMSGNARDAKQLQQYYNFLREDQRFALVDLPDLVKTEAGFSFTLILTNFKPTKS